VVLLESSNRLPRDVFKRDRICADVGNCNGSSIERDKAFYLFDQLAVNLADVE